MGVVYEALDRERGQLVALKTLPRLDANGIYRLKQEFRALADVHHDNLVRLHELVASDAGVFFSMELVHGVDFAQYVRNTSTPRPSSPPPSAVVTLAATPGVEEAAHGCCAAVRTTLAPSAFSADENRLRAALKQLVLGVLAIHGAGKLHRDLKPSNVLVTTEGRVVILDFGVATELVGGEARASGSRETVGTARYMAPEQLGGEGNHPASDWYSVGVMLYEVLAGRVPFTGSLEEVLALKNIMDPVPPSATVTGVPRDLDDLCMALLSRDPRRRPKGNELPRRLGASASSAPPQLIASLDASALVGREAQLDTLRVAFEGVRSGRSITVRVGGPSGIGKSTIVHHFLDDLAQNNQALVLRGRVYEREEVPYKAVDNVIDALSAHLLRLSEAAAPVDLPPDMGALARIFPVLRRVPEVGARHEEPAGDPRQFRRRAFAALRAVITSLASRQPLVLFVDDAQWGDADSAALLLDLMRPPDAPAVLLLMTSRDDEGADTSPFLAELRVRWPKDAEVRDVAVGPLDLQDAHRLALTLLGSDDELTLRTARAVARESRGSPFLIEELVRSNRGLASNPGQTLAVVTLDRMVGQRLERLPPNAQRLVEVVAVGGRPLSLSVAGSASGLEEKVNEVVGFVSARRFTRMGVRDGRDVVEPIHDRIGETVVSLLPKHKLRAHHERLATILEGRPDSDPDAVALHWIEAGQAERATRFARAAADKAYAALAYERAAHLYVRAIDLATDPAEKATMLARRADALASAGRVAEAGPAFLEAAAHAEPVDALDLRRQAAEQFVFAAQFDAANSTLRHVLASVGMSMPASRGKLVLSFLMFRALLRLRGLRFVVHDEATIPKRVLVQLDACLAVARVFSVTDPLLGVYFQTRLLLLALRCGESYRLAYALCLEAAYRSASGVEARGRAQESVDRALEVVRISGNERAQKAMLPSTQGFAALMQGRCEEALALCDQAAANIVWMGPGMYWAMRQSQLNSLWALGHLGTLGELFARLTRSVNEALACGDRWTATTLRAGWMFSLAWLNDHEPEEIRSWIEEDMQGWTDRAYHNQHWFACTGLVVLDLWQGRGRDAYDRMQREIPRARRALKLKMEIVRVEAYSFRARGAVMAASQAEGAERSRLIEVARKDARWLRRSGPPAAAAAAALVEAAIAKLEGDDTRCSRALEEAVTRADEVSHRLLGAVARIRLGALRGKGGRALGEAGEAYMRAEGVRDVARMAAVFRP
jgi:eukaryotic-like serine/threonine-protein kinase